ncbi:MAG: right-handed parallel beta-helix repeat-containing protein [Candidatus Heimdallarchaeota archaeon]|nr:MAG: right-handed parallel beta-helix repeat-containing protein [Candidatus Heimdallarchaeota archaeon]
MKIRKVLLLIIVFFGLTLFNINLHIQYKLEQHLIYNSSVPLLQESHCNIQIQEEVNNQKISRISPKISSSSSVMAYEMHDPFYIDDNADFGPAGYNFTGDGTFNKPYLIEGYQITNNSFHLIHIENTTAFFKISSNLLNGISRNYNGVFLKNVTYGIVFNNSITNCVGAVNLENSYNNTVTENVLSYSTNGIRLSYSDNNTLTINTVYNSTNSGIYYQYSLNNTCFNNTAYNNTWAGIWFTMSNNSKIILNKVYSNGWDGIGLQVSRDNNISDNKAYYNALAGIKLINSTNNDLFRNSAYQNSEDGVYLDSSDINTIVDNDAYQNSESGLFSRYSIKNNITLNSFYSNAENGNTLVNSHNNTIDNNYIFCNGNTTACSHGISELSMKIQQFGGGNGIFMDPSNYNNITNNDIFNNTDDGIELVDSNYNLIDGNDIYGNGNNGGGSSRGISDISFSIQQFGGGNGIFMDPSDYNKITGNNIFNNSENGIRLDNSSHNLIDGNDIYGNGNNGGGSSRTISDISFLIQQFGGGNGVFMDPSDHNNITGNEIHNNSGDGITVINSSFNIIEDNDIYGNGNGGGGGSSEGTSEITSSIMQLGGGNGIFMDPSDGNTISRNTIQENNHHGILLIDSDETSIYDNLVIHNSLYGIYINSGASNQIYWNDMVGNNLEGTSQAFDEGIESSFRYNYWDEWTSPDDDEGEGDGIVDDPYSIDGYVGNFDNSPLTYPHNPETLDIHLISRPRVKNPNGGETVSEVITIRWAKATDYWGHIISYNVYYSGDNGESWNSIESDISNLYCRWDTTEIIDGSDYLVKVVAICSEGLQVEDISDSTFTIENDKQPEETRTESSKETTSSTKEEVSAPSLLLFLFAVSVLITIKQRFREKSL